MDILCQKVAVSKSRPRSTIVRIVRDKLSVILDGLVIVTTSCTELSHLAKTGDRGHVPLLTVRGQVVRLERRLTIGGGWLPRQDIVTRYCTSGHG